jgi:hypothetical protein
LRWWSWRLIGLVCRSNEVFLINEEDMYVSLYWELLVYTEAQSRQMYKADCAVWDYDCFLYGYMYDLALAQNMDKASL